MANTKSAAKRTRQTARRALRNSSISSQLRTLQKRALAAAKADPDQIRSVISAIDKAAKRGVIHRNAAIRRKARLTRALSTAK
jgi:small subunit ribosomal protein S20